MIKYIILSLLCVVQISCYAMSDFLSKLGLFATNFVWKSYTGKDQPPLAPRETVINRIITTTASSVIVNTISPKEESVKAATKIDYTNEHKEKSEASVSAVVTNQSQQSQLYQNINTENATELYQLIRNTNDVDVIINRVNFNADQRQVIITMKQRIFNTNNVPHLETAQRWMRIYRGQLTSHDYQWFLEQSLTT